MKNSDIWLRNRIFFYLSFFSAGTQGIITQLFVRNNYPAEKELILPLILIAGSIAYISGISLSGKYLGMSARTAKIVLCLNVAAFLALLTVKSVVFYTILYVLACFSCNFVYNFMDHHFISSSRQTGVSTHVKSMLSFQMLAYMLAPIFYSVSIGNQAATLIVTALVAVIGLMPVVKICNESNKPIPVEKSRPEQVGLSTREKIFVLYTTLFLAVVAIAVSMMVYIMSEYYAFPDFAAKSGIVLMIVSIASGLGIMLLKSPAGGDFSGDRKAVEIKNFRPRLQVAVISMTLFMTLLLLGKFLDSFIYVAVIFAVMGFVYGLFLSSTRKFVGITTVQTDRQDLLTVYNNLQSISLLVGYGACIILTVIVRWMRVDFYSSLMMVIVLALLVELALIFLWIYLHRKETVISD